MEHKNREYVKKEAIYSVKASGALYNLWKHTKYLKNLSKKKKEYNKKKKK